VAEAGEKSVRQLHLEASLLHLLDRFDQQPSSSGVSLREWLNTRPVEFCSLVGALLKQRAEHSPVRQFLASLLAGFPDLPKILSDPAAMSPSAASQLVAEIARSDPTVDVKLTRWLLRGVGPSPDPVAAEPARVIRLLDILSGACCSSRALVNLVQLLRHPDPKVRSKVTLLTGRVMKSASWVESRMEDADPRVRSNAIETLWRVEAPGVVDVLKKALRDSNNRVVGNALVGLCLSGDRTAVTLLEEMAGHESSAFRATAAWAMGFLQDATFIPVLGKLLKDPEAIVRRNALRALARIKRATGQTLPASPAETDPAESHRDDQPSEAV